MSHDALSGPFIFLPLQVICLYVIFSGVGSYGITVCVNMCVSAAISYAFSLTSFFFCLIVTLSYSSLFVFIIFYYYSIF